jgi:glycosyltransferase involved in cell wall biosynthesis
MGEPLAGFKSGAGRVDDTVSIVMAAYWAEPTIGYAVQSVMAQSHARWELLVVSDDGVDYARLLYVEGIADPRIRHLDTGGIGTGSSAARNVGLMAMGGRYGAVLDADYRFKPEKLARSLTALTEHAIVTTALEVMTDDFTTLRYVGHGEDRVLRAGAHKFTNFSMDSMVVWDRERTYGRYDPALPNMTDLDFLLRLYEHAATSFHIGEPLHDYIKLTRSLSNGEGVAERMIRAKTAIRSGLVEQRYRLADPEGASGMIRFLDISLDAEKTYGEALAARPGLLFEDHIEPLLEATLISAASTSVA